DYVNEKTGPPMSDFSEAIPIEAVFSVVELVHVDRAEIARVGKMQELLAAGIAGHNRSHRFHHMIVTIYFVDESDARLGMAMRAGHNAVPDVRRVNHPRRRRFFDQSIRKIRSVKGLLV